jgi:hypothetical protein
MHFASQIAGAQRTKNKFQLQQVVSIMEDLLAQDLLHAKSYNLSRLHSQVLLQQKEGHSNTSLAVCPA